MSINWVMLEPSRQPPFTPLPGEQTLYTSPPRVAVSISTPAHYPGKVQTPFSCTSSSGYLHLTTRRLIYLPTQQTEKFRSFATPFLNLHDSHVTAPFFGPNVWQALLQPVRDGNIPTPSSGVVELKFTFKDGGAFDFHSKFEQLKERAQQVQETSRMGDDGNSTGRVDLEDLPVYQEENDGPLLAPIRSSGYEHAGGHEHDQQRTAPPTEPPPGYEEASQSSRPGS